MFHVKHYERCKEYKIWLSGFKSIKFGRDRNILEKTICLDQYGIIVWFVFLWADLLFFSITPQNN